MSYARRGSTTLRIGAVAPDIESSAAATPPSPIRSPIQGPDIDTAVGDGGKRQGHVLRLFATGKLYRQSLVLRGETKICSCSMQ